MKTKSESIVKYVARLALTLLIITSVVAAALAGVMARASPLAAEMTIRPKVPPQVSSTSIT